MPKLRHATFESQVIERYRRRETSVEEALVEMYLAGVSVRRVEDITDALCPLGCRGEMCERLLTLAGYPLSIRPGQGYNGADLWVPESLSLSRERARPCPLPTRPPCPRAPRPNCRS